MASDLFELAAEQLEQQTALERLEVRGTLRLALKQAGLSPRGLDVAQLAVVFEKLMPGELVSRGIEDAATACDAVMKHIANSAVAAEPSTASSTDEVFKRLAKR